MSQECKNFCDLFKINNPIRPIYMNQRRCSKCECFVPLNMLRCDCCKCNTKAKPSKSVNRQKYILLHSNRNIEVLTIHK